MKKYLIFLIACMLTALLLPGCTTQPTREPLKAIPLPEAGINIWASPDTEESIDVITEEEASALAFSTRTEDEMYGILPWDKESQHWGNLYTHSVCWADVTILETRDCLYTWHEFLTPVTLARCKVNDVLLPYEQCTLLPGDEVTIVLNSSMHVPYDMVPPFKENGRYLVPVEDMTQMALPSGWQYYRPYAQYRAVCDHWFHMEIIGEGNFNPKVDTEAMGRFLGLDQVPGCRDYLSWGTRDVANLFKQRRNDYTYLGPY